MIHNQKIQEQQTPIEPWQGRLPFFYGWVIVAVGFLMGFIAGGSFWAASVIAIPMREDLEWSLSSIYLGLTVRMLVDAAGMFFLGRFGDLKHGARIVGVISGAIAAISLAAIAFIDSQWEFILFYGAISGMTTSGTGFLVMSAVVPRWILRRMEGNGNPNVRILERVSRFDGIKPDIHMNESFLGYWCFTTVPNFEFNQCDRFPQSNLVAKVPQ